MRRTTRRRLSKYCQGMLQPWNDLEFQSISWFMGEGGMVKYDAFGSCRNMNWEIRCGLFESDYESLSMYL